VCHFSINNREALEKGFAVQKQSLPGWYPAAVWNEIVTSIEDIDVVPIALPIYQKYMSEEIAQNAIRLFLTPQGQAMISRVYASSAQSIASGDTASEARLKALAAEKAEEDARIHEMLDSMTPAEHRAVEAFMHSADWKHFQEITPRIAKEFSSAYAAKQEALTREISERHQADLATARKQYKPEPQGSSSTSQTAPQ
jgi:hypothetical protein